MGGDPFVWRDGSRLTPYMLYQINRLSADLNAAFGCRVVVTSGIRTEAEQTSIFLSRYVTAGNVRGRKVYDTRWWKGQLWYRVSSAGTVAQPKTSNHEIQGDSAAVDIRDTGSDAGITSKNSKRGRWIRANAWKYGLVAEGDGFGEGWHFKVLKIWSAVPSGTVTPKPKGVTVIHYNRADATCRGTNGGRKLAKGENFWLNTTKGAATSQASNIVGGIGNYTFAVHVYATGTPGDSIDVTLYWGRGKAESGHYNEHLVFPADGKLQVSVPYIRAVASGWSVYARLGASSSNKGPVSVTMFDTDALLIV